MTIFQGEQHLSCLSELIQKLSAERDLSDAELKLLLETGDMDNALFFAADSKRREIYGDEVYIRGLIEFTNYCKNNCYYCGIRRDNVLGQRYRLSTPANMPSRNGWSAVNAEHCTADAPGPRAVKSAWCGAALAAWTMEQNTATTRPRWMRNRSSGRSSPLSILS